MVTKHFNGTPIVHNIYTSAREEDIVSKTTSENFINFVTILVVPSKPDVIFFPNSRYSSPKHCAAPAFIAST